MTEAELQRRDQAEHLILKSSLVHRSKNLSTKSQNSSSVSPVQTAESEICCLGVSLRRNEKDSLPAGYGTKGLIKLLAQLISNHRHEDDVLRLAIPHPIIGAGAMCPKQHVP